LPGRLRWMLNLTMGKRLLQMRSVSDGTLRTEQAVLTYPILKGGGSSKPQ
jgi:hypothetical protein